MSYTIPWRIVQLIILRHGTRQCHTMQWTITCQVIWRIRLSDIILYCIMSYHIIMHYDILYLIILKYVILYCVLLYYTGFMVHDIMSCHTTWYHIISYRIGMCYIVLCFIMRSYIIWPCLWCCHLCNVVVPIDCHLVAHAHDTGQAPAMDLALGRVPGLRGQGSRWPEVR